MKHNGSTMVNTEFAKAILEMSDKQFISALTTGNLKTVEILCNTLVVLEGKQYQKLLDRACAVQIQNLDSTAERFVSAGKANSETCELVEIKKDIEVMSFEGDRYIRLSDVPASGLYNKKEKIPYMKVCGSIYIALDCAVRGKENDSIIFTKKERK